MANEIEYGLDEETALQLAVVDRLVDRLPWTNEKTVRADVDEIVPATIGDHCVLVLNDGAAPTGSHSTSGGSYEVTFSIRIVIVQRLAQIPRDRLGQVLTTKFLATQWSINAKFWQCVQALDFNYDVIQAANQLLHEHGDKQIVLSGGEYHDGFIEPLRLETADPRPQSVDSAIFAGAPRESTAAHVGLRRSARLTGAKRMKSRTQSDAQ